MKGKHNNDTQQYFSDYKLKGAEVNMRLENGTECLVFQKLVHKQICRLCHGETGHLGLKNTFE